MRKQPDALSPTPPHHSPAHISKKSHDINTKQEAQEATAGSSKSKSKTRAAELKPLPYHFFILFFSLLTQQKMDFHCEEMKNRMFTTCLAQVFKAFFHCFFSLLPQQKVDFQRDEMKIEL
jgi:hypothetical protein